MNFKPVGIAMTVLSLFGGVFAAPAAEAPKGETGAVHVYLYDAQKKPMSAEKVKGTVYLEMKNGGGKRTVALAMAPAESGAPAGPKGDLRPLGDGFVELRVTKADEPAG